MKQHLKFDGPILPGSISTAWSKCGKPVCACKDRMPSLHGPYYRWTGFVAGRRTTRTISETAAAECKRRIMNYRNMQKLLDALLRDALDRAPWIEETARKTRRQAGGGKRGERR